MADIFCHATEGGLCAALPFLSFIKKRTTVWILASFGMLFGALPDLIGAYGNLVFHDHWTLYRSAHYGQIAGVLQYIPMYWLHIKLDAVMHGRSAHWWVWNERLWLEVLLWIINVTIIARSVRWWRRHRSSPQ